MDRQDSGEVDKAAGRTTVLEGLRRLDMLSYPEVIEQAPAVLTKLDKPLNGWIYDIMGQPAWKAKTEPVTFDFIIEKWATNTNAPKRGKQDKTQRPTALLLGSVTMIWRG